MSNLLKPTFTEEELSALIKHLSRVWPEYGCGFPTYNPDLKFSLVLVENSLHPLHRQRALRIGDFRGHIITIPYNAESVVLLLKFLSIESKHCGGVRDLIECLRKDKEKF